MVLEELAEVPLVAVLADHVEWVAIGDANAHHADKVRVIETSQDSRLLDEVGPVNSLACPREALKVRVFSGGDFSESLRETRAGRQPGGGIHATFSREICTPEWFKVFKL